MNNREIPIDTLEAAKEWAQERIRQRGNSPWTHYRLMQLIEATEELLAGTKVVIKKVDSQQLDQPSEDGGRPLTADIYRLETVPHHSDKIRVQMPTI